MYAARKEINIIRFLYQEAIRAIYDIASCILAADKNARIDCFPDQLTGSSLCLEITTSLVVIDMVDRFCSALKKADSFEFYPRTDGLIGFGVVFENTFVPAPPFVKTKESKQ